jgi:hypothetical protein
MDYTGVDGAYCNRYIVSISYYTFCRSYTVNPKTGKVTLNISYDDSDYGGHVRVSEVWDIAGKYGQVESVTYEARHYVVLFRRNEGGTSHLYRVDFYPDEPAYIYSPDVGEYLFNLFHDHAVLIS